MEKEESFKLIHSIDPTTIKVPIRERFAKLTLSSNKKKTAIEKKISVNTDKRQSASRNLMSELGNNNENITMESGKQSKIHKNPLLQSFSSSSSEEELPTQSYSTESNRKKLDLNSSNTMEPLRLSEDCDQHRIDEEQHLNILSQQFSYMDLKTDDCSKTKDVCYENDNIVQTRHVAKNSPNVALELSDTESNSVISISDSSDCEGNLHSNCGIITSTLQNEEQELLPNLLSTEKALRINAFLRDVSMERKIMESSKQTENEKTKSTPFTSGIAPSISGDTTSKAQQLARADTESMSSLDENTSLLVRQNLVVEPYVRSKNDNEICKQLVDTINVDNVAETHITEGKHSPISIKTKSLNSSIQSVPPEESIVIPETSSESEHSLIKSAKKTTNRDMTSKSSDSNDEPAPSQVQVNVARINISAKINIRIQVEQSSSDDEEDLRSAANLDKSSNDSNMESQTFCDDIGDKSVNSNQKWDKLQKTPLHKPQIGKLEQLITETAKKTTPPKLSPDRTNDLTKTVSPDSVGEKMIASENFVANAEKLLNKLYGNTWQTPDVIRSLRRPHESKASTLPKSSSIVISDTPTTSKRHQKNIKRCNSDNGGKEESILDDFSIFRHNIPTQANSTYLQSKAVAACADTPKVCRSNQKNYIAKATPNAPEERNKVTTRCGRTVKQRCKQDIVLHDTDGDNASDDEDLDNTDSDFSTDIEKGTLSGNSSSDFDDVRVRKRTGRRARMKEPKEKQKSDNALIYLDLSKNEITVQDGTPATPPANNDKEFDSRLQDILNTCKPENKPKLETIPKGGLSKRKLFTANFGYEEERETEVLENKPVLPIGSNELVEDLENVNITSLIEQKKFEILNKNLEAIKTGKPVFTITPPRSIKKVESTSQTKKNKTSLEAINNTPDCKYGFLKSLDVRISKTFAHPNALMFRDNYRTKKEELAMILYDLYNEKLFGGKLNVPLVWNKKLLNTAGRCLNKRKLGIRTSVVELSDKVLTSADRLRCTLIHELCHAATWVFNGASGHGSVWKDWARKANGVFPELPKIGVCHQYDIEYKYTYKCTLCGAKSHAHSKSKKVDNIRCSYCHGAIQIFLNKKDKDGNIAPTPVRGPSGFAKFVQDNYKQYKRTDRKHADVMKILSTEFAALKMVSPKT